MRYTLALPQKTLAMLTIKTTGRNSNNREIIQGVLVVFYNNLARESLLAPTPLPLICQAGARFSSNLILSTQNKTKPQPQCGTREETVASTKGAGQAKSAFIAREYICRSDCRKKKEKFLDADKPVCCMVDNKDMRYILN